MTLKLTFLGAAGNVTGSRFLLETDKRKILVDCGLYQERDFLHRNWEEFGFEPSSIHAVLLTHAHIDHCGLLPKLVKEGFKGPVYCTSATAEIARISLLDAAKMQEEDAAFKKKRHEAEGRKGPYPEVPLYTMEDARAAIPLFSAVDYAARVELGPGLSAAFYNAGHVLGSASIKLDFHDGDKLVTLLFSGDIGRWQDPLLEAPTLFDSADDVVMEATYGGQTHESEQQAAGRLADIINETVKAGGNIVIPSFALERAQSILYYVSRFIVSRRIPPLPVYLDSPMAVDITGVFKRHPEFLAPEIRDAIAAGHSPFDFPGLKLVSGESESRAVGNSKGPAVIIAGSGMATGGRIKNHLAANISRPGSAVVFVGYQSANTLGRLIVDGAKEVRILGQNYPVRARIEKLDGFSAHADSSELLKWLGNFKQPPRRVFIVHSEPETAQKFAGVLERQKPGWHAVIPEFKSEYEM
jgi:metallo-beta-lactamase family protein